MLRLPFLRKLCRASLIPNKPMFRPVRLLLLPLLALSLAACATLHAETHPGEADFVHQVAAATGKSVVHLTDLLNDAENKQSIIDAMNRPAESMAWSDYRKIFMTRTRMAARSAFSRPKPRLPER